MEAAGIVYLLVLVAVPLFLLVLLAAIIGGAIWLGHSRQAHDAVAAIERESRRRQAEQDKEDKEHPERAIAREIGRVADATWANAAAQWGRPHS